jgi:HD-GYP domain-containing protein (c-di-GMP phosphodiesterase class II)
LSNLEANTLEQSYSLFPVDNLVDNSVTDFDLFIGIEENFVLYSGVGYRWNRDELTKLLNAGHRRFYIRRRDLMRASTYEAIVRLPAINIDLSPKERIREIEELGGKFTRCLFDGEIAETCVSKAEAIAGHLTDCILEDRRCVAELGGLVGHDYYTYYHSIRVSAYAVAIAVAMGLKDAQLLQQIALGGIFHDIGKRSVPLELLNKTGALTNSEWDLMQAHPVRGYECIAGTVLSQVPREIVLHHHERRNGKGYPHGLDKGSLLPEVQIATLADIFDALTSSRAYQVKRSRFDALDFIKTKLLKDEVCPDAFRALVNCLAV